MRRIIFLIASVLMWAGCFAQDDTSPMWGLKAAFDVNLPGDWHNSSGHFKMYRHGYGFAAGPVCNVYLGRGFYLEPGVSIYYDSYSYYNLAVTDSDGTAVDYNPSLYKIGVRVPVVGGYSFNVTPTWAMSVYTGPEFSYSFAGKVRIDEPADPDNQMPDMLFDGHRRFDCAWKIGVGVPYRNIMVSFEGAIGITDLLKSSETSFRENRFSIGLTYFF